MCPPAITWGAHGYTSLLIYKHSIPSFFSTLITSNDMVMNYPQPRTDSTSSQSVVMLSMLILMLLMGRAIYVAVSSDATLKGISILIVYSLILILVGFIAGVNASKIKSAKQQENSFFSNSELSQTPVDFKPNLASYNSTEQFT